MAFNPKQEYQIIPDNIGLKDFSEYSEDYITRPPYQRKSVWSVKKQQGLFDSFFRRYYVPRLVIREVRLSEDKTVREIIDGQQRITAIQEFFQASFDSLIRFATSTRICPARYSMSYPLICESSLIRN